MNPLLVLPLLLAPAQGIRTYVLKDKTEIRAEVLGLEGESVRLRAHVTGGTAETTRKISDFVPHSAFNLLRATSPADDVQAHVKLAEFAIENGLVDAARRELLKARDLANDQRLAPDFEHRLVARAVTVLDRLLRQMLEDGRIQDARFIVSQILSANPSRLTDAQKAEFVDLVEGTVEKRKEDAARAKEARADAASSARREQSLEPVRKTVDRGKSMHRQALLASDKAARAIGAFDQAIQAFDSAEKGAGKLMEGSPDDRVLADEAHALVAEAQEYRTSSLLSQASLYVVRSNFNAATGNVNRILADDPENAQALAMRARIELAANEGDWGGAVVGGFGRVR